MNSVEAVHFSTWSKNAFENLFKNLHVLIFLDYIIVYKIKDQFFKK